MIPHIEAMMRLAPRLTAKVARLPRPQRRWATKLGAATATRDHWRAYAELQGLWPSTRAAALLNENELDVPWPPKLTARLEQEPAFRRWRLLDALTFLPERVLAKVDRASMHHSLEVRVPLLDHRVVETALALPPGLTRNKAVQRELLVRKLPGRRIPRKKRGFEVPLRRWLATELKTEVESALSPDALDRLGIRPDTVAEAWREHQAGRVDLSEPLFGLWLLVRWSGELDVSV